MYGLDSLTEHSTFNVEFSRESDSFMRKDRGGGSPGKWAGVGRVESRVGVLNGWKVGGITGNYF